jgi:hypothetical protein
MPRIPFTMRTVPFVTELGTAAPAQRPFLSAQFLGHVGRRLPYPAFLDTGSPYSVVPYRLAMQVPWKDIGEHLLLGSQRRSVEWNGIPCRLGEVEVELVDTSAFVRTRALRVLAKIARQQAPSHLEQAVLLGMSFLADNRARQELDATGAGLSGHVWVA